jgi:hypothetical protein
VQIYLKSIFKKGTSHQKNSETVFSAFREEDAKKNPENLQDIH